MDVSGGEITNFGYQTVGMMIDKAFQGPLWMANHHYAWSNEVYSLPLVCDEQCILGIHHAWFNLTMHGQVMSTHYCWYVNVYYEYIMHG